MEHRFSRLNPRLKVGISAISAFDSKVRCWSDAGWRRLEAAQAVEPGVLGGLADIYTFEIHVPHYVCETLDALMTGD